MSKSKKPIISDPSLWIDMLQYAVVDENGVVVAILQHRNQAERLIKTFAHPRDWEIVEVEMDLKLRRKE